MIVRSPDAFLHVDLFSGFGRTHVIEISDIAVMIEIFLDEVEGAVISSASVEVLPGAQG